MSEEHKPMPFIPPLVGVGVKEGERLNGPEEMLNHEFTKIDEGFYISLFHYSTDIKTKRYLSIFDRCISNEEEEQHELGLKAVAELTKQYLQQEVPQTTITTRSNSL